MLKALLQTKLYVPRLKPGLVSRPHLLEKLDRLRERKLALISAPAGFGKSTLLSEWIEHQEEQQPPLEVAWLSLDSNDNDPARFMTYVVAALQKVNASFGEEALPFLQAFQIASIEAIWEVLAAQIVSGTCQIVLVLDDYHVIDAPIIHEGIAFILEQMPACMHLVISTRADPPVPLSRLRVRGELVELRAADLRFSAEETGEFLDLWVGQKLSPSDQLELKERTEGWIAGLQLAALALQGLVEKAPGDEDRLSAFVQRLSGSTRYIMDYLVEEVLQHLPEDTRSFLLQTSILERLTAPLCDAVTGRSDSQWLLEALEKTNNFLFALDDERGWYRYHHLFASLLHTFLQNDQPEGIPELHEKASAWYESQGLVMEAIQHALKVPDLDQATRLMEKAALTSLMNGEAIAVQKWSAWISEEHAQQRPFLCVWFAMAFLISDKVEPAERYLSLVRQDNSIHSPPATELHGHFKAACSMLAYLKGDYENAIRFADEALEKLPPEQTYLRGGAAFTSGVAHEKTGEEQAAFEAFQEARQISHAFGNRTAEVSALKKLGDLHLRRGQLHQADLAYRQALQLVSIREGQYLPVAGLTVSAMALLLYEWDRLEEAEDYSLQGVELARRLGSSYALLMNLQNLASIRWIHGDRESALQLRQETEQILLGSPLLPSFEAQVSIQQVRMYLRMGDTQAAARWARAREQDRKPGHGYYDELVTILEARGSIAQEKAQEAIEGLKRALPQARAAGRWGVVIELLVLQALALAMQRQVHPAVAALEESLRLAEPEGYTRMFLDEGEPMARLLRMAYRSKAKGARVYEAGLLEKLAPAAAPALPGLPKMPASRPDEHSVLIDPLTERELEILQMILDGYSNQEIGEKLFVTLGTVKAHISHIYSKLDVRSRAQAIKKADQLGLLKS